MREPKTSWMLQLDALEKELRAREQYWHRRELEEVRLAEHLGHLSHELLSVPGEDAQRQLRAAEEACAALESCHLQETQRRARALSVQSGPERGLLSRADREEGEQEAQVALGMQRVLQSLGHAAEKLGQAAGRLRGQEEETWLQQSRGQSPQIWNRLRKVVQHLSDEFQEVLRERQNFLDRALGHLQYQRELSRLHLLHTQVRTLDSAKEICMSNLLGLQREAPKAATWDGWEPCMEPGADYFVLDCCLRSPCLFGELPWRQILWNSHGFSKGPGCCLPTLDPLPEEPHCSASGSSRLWSRTRGSGARNRYR
ncbi:uncharacterized protein LOC123602199 [Leopardus geoffroyi]|uniref:uncharacterized protein LOC123602199 n=1 Tax=Leopardus geoffroyi TaxID=46844 RepID=UPI001E262927|nr:uncharacterized protein LOC123602199 [Leopardus geoffroyi]